MKNNLYRFIEDQTHFGMPRGAKMSLALDEPKWVAPLSIPSTTYKRAPQVERKYLCCMQNNQ